MDGNVGTGRKLDGAPGGAELRKERKGWRAEAWDWIVSIAAALLVVFVLRTFLFQIIRVDGNSMFSTLANNERLFVNVLDVRLNGVERGDIVVCHYPNRGRTNFVKRVVAVPGDVVYREGGVTHVVYEADGSAGIVDEALDPVIDGQPHPYLHSPDYAPYTLGEDEYFVVGDNRYDSHDSRDWKDDDPSRDVGTIAGDRIVGRVSRVIWPVGSARSLE